MHFTPLAAVTAMGGFYFARRLPAVLLPIGVLSVSDVLLPAHDNGLVHISVYAMMIVPLLLGRTVRHSEGGRKVATELLAQGARR